MKCPNCGAETQNKICEFCGSEMPKERETVNITNNYYGDTPMQEQGETTVKGSCPKCGSTKISFKRERIAVATRSNSRKKALGSGSKGQSYSQSAYRTIGLCQNCGFTWNPNANSTVGTTGKRGAPTWLWVLGWIFIFPVPLTVLLLRKKEMNSILKYGIIAVAWLLYLLIAFSGKPDDSNSNSQIDTKATTKIEVDNSISTDEKVDEISTEDSDDAAVGLSEYIDRLVEDYNSSADEKLVFKEDFTPSDKSSGHYRTEFRLGAYKDAIGKSYLLGDKVVDIIATGSQGRESNRIYTNDVSFEQVESLLTGMSPLMDPELSAAEFNEAMTEVRDKKTANGLYFGKLGLVLLGSEEKGYEMMLK